MPILPSLQKQIDEKFAKLYKLELALKEKLKEINEEKKDLAKEQKKLWTERNMTFFDVWAEEEGTGPQLVAAQS